MANTDTYLHRRWQLAPLFLVDLKILQVFMANVKLEQISSLTCVWGEIHPTFSMAFFNKIFIRWYRHYPTWKNAGKMRSVPQAKQLDIKGTFRFWMYELRSTEIFIGFASATVYCFNCETIVKQISFVSHFLSWVLSILVLRLKIVIHLAQSVRVVNIVKVF